MMSGGLTLGVVLNDNAAGRVLELWRVHELTETQETVRGGVDLTARPAGKPERHEPREVARLTDDRRVQVERVRAGRVILGFERHETVRANNQVPARVVGKDPGRAGRPICFVQLVQTAARHSSADGVPRGAVQSGGRLQRTAVFRYESENSGSVAARHQICAQSTQLFRYNNDQMPYESHPEAIGAVKRPTRVLPPGEHNGMSVYALSHTGTESFAVFPGTQVV